LNIINNNTW